MKAPIFLNTKAFQCLCLITEQVECTCVHQLWLCSCSQDGRYIAWRSSCSSLIPHSRWGLLIFRPIVTKFPWILVCPTIRSWPFEGFRRLFWELRFAGSFTTRCIGHKKHRSRQIPLRFVWDMFIWFSSCCWFYNRSWAESKKSQSNPASNDRTGRSWFIVLRSQR